MLEMATYLECTGPIPETAGIVACVTYTIPLCYVLVDRRRQPEGIFAGTRWSAVLCDATILAVWLLVALGGIAVLAATYKVTNYFSVETLLSAALVPAFALVTALASPLRLGYLHALTGIVWCLSLSLVGLNYVGFYFWLNLLWPLMIGGFVGSRLHEPPRAPTGGNKP